MSWKPDHTALFLMLFLVRAALLPGQVLVCGTGSASMPKELSEKTNFAIKSTDNILFRFKSGASANLIKPSSGAVYDGGLSLNASAGYVSLRKLSAPFRIQTQLALLKASDCSFFMQSSPKGVKLVVTRGEMTAETRSKELISLHTGETCLIGESKHKTRKIEANDTAFWRRTPGKALKKGNLSAGIPKKFGELYIYGMAVLKMGGGTAYFADQQKKPRKAEDSDIYLTSGSRVITAASETALLTLGQKTTVKIMPDSEILLKSAQIDLVNGECVIKHGRNLMPLKVSGKTPMLVMSQSSVEVLRNEDSLLLTVQQGSVRTPDGGQELSAGMSYRLTGKTAVSVSSLEYASVSRAGRLSSPLIRSNSETDVFDKLMDTDSFMVFDDSPIIDGDGTTRSREKEKPANLLKQYEN